ncbi:MULTISPECIES: peptide-methionine (S)-S-oxide reductase MsrA [unclassified Colwellia]|uniref:peptide-methionine (S)-S-oxide reductase MsrA n=1 Tax=unclassified Colwellia TaxID=196834 RepID=UPI0015F74DCB|nr:MULTISPECIES: peptide-methionine (S)-S-oxide reductase MsrA [unclassified Colwellia]MBA6354264.1 peptide-methionine (S)-S-oxide reductase MsrA [Colwellia sp. BRX8-3]MBA6358469.1 peptide-methionine (S)-S-oxide reductase MsrA [Colwellia sp. BRX8-6]MBA6367829.1 peptide-methionine (S)-S-oxide reductase MsrA [Colwellia sp. BRX8-5]MBA6374310.1 peptide-methionine (S)-S-oxide reductase MsrA [Colwellia sp. BRX8-2]MBA6382446.1 peptide-methionine (S)-S-oxide reductase MsrA [Colwellia sp. BRX10-9]
MSSHEEKITLAGGCFWCIEGAYNQLIGIKSAVSGYMGGSAALATYEDVCSGQTGHAEVVQLTFDSTAITSREILEVFFTLHDASQLNRQGNDIGTQYRSGIFYHNKEQQQIAEDIIKEVDASNMYSSAVVTEVTQASEFFSGEDVHQDYFNNNPGNPYCQAIVSPKLAKFRKTFVGKLKPSET